MSKKISSKKKVANFELWSLTIAKTIGRIICLAFAICELISLACNHKCNYYILIVIMTGLEITKPYKGLIELIKNIKNKKVD